ncbi:MAG TPA: PIG-L family deacetylase [Thermomicrobiales bacterium]|nr:PIG-L family deacetylase [Thermomicrobiales bacterium]
MSAAEDESVTSQIFVAPHSDDVALSCGGAVALAAKSGTPTIVTLFAGRPSGPVGEFARLQHERWGLADDEVFERRRREDRCAASALGPSVRVSWLDYLDAIYRDPRYSFEDALFGELAIDDRALIAPIADALALTGAGEFVVPVAIGHHVDHQLAHLVGGALAARGYDVWAYEDMPYALLDPSPASSVGVLETSNRRMIVVDDDGFERKCRAIECYASQLPVIFRDVGDFRVALDRHARAIGGSSRVEVQWRLTSRGFQPYGNDIRPSAPVRENV